MKKIKLLTPILGLTTLTTVFVPLTSCGNNSSDETNRVHPTYGTPEVGKNFDITFTLDDGYSLDLVESTIEFGSSNETIYLNRCVVDSSNKKITVPGTLVTSTTVSVNLKSVKSTQPSQDQMKQAIKNVFEEYDSKNMTLVVQSSGKLYDKTTSELLKEAIITDTTLKDIAGNYECTSTYYPDEGEPETGTYWIKKDENHGWWELLKYSSKYYGYSIATSPFNYIVGCMGFDIDTFIQTLQYDSILNTFSQKFKYGDINIAFTFVFDKSGNLTHFYADNEYDNTYGHVKLNVLYRVTDKGTTSSFTIPEFTKLEISPDEFTYNSDQKRLEYEEQYTPTSKRNRFTTPKFSEKYTAFDKTRKTYIHYNKTTLEPYYTDDVAWFIELWNGNKLLTRKQTESSSGDYFINYGKDKPFYIEINENTLDASQNLFLMFNATNYSMHSTSPYIYITQDKPA